MTRFLFRKLAFVQLAVAALLLGVVAPGVGTASAQTSDEVLVGIQGLGHASGIYITYNLGGVLPVASPVDSAAPDALATMSSGPSTFARAGVFDPGDLLASPDTAASLLGFPGYEPGTIPPFPYRIQATSGFGEPAAESNPAPGLRAYVEALAESSVSFASAGESSAPGLFSVGGVTTTASTLTDGATVTAYAKTEVTGINLFDVVKIESLVTEVVATSQGSTVTVSGGSTIGGATLMGQAVVIDGEGVHPEDDGGNAPLLGGLSKSLTEQASELLSEAGITITAGGTVDQASGDEGFLSATGLKVVLDIDGRSLPLLSDVFELFDQLPITPQVPGAPVQLADLLEVVRANNIFQIDFGRAEVALATRTAPPIPAFEPTTPTFPSSPTPTTPIVTPTPSISSGGPTLPAATPTTPVTSPTANVGGTPVAVPPAQVISSPTPTSGHALGTIVVLALLAQPFLGRWLSRFGQRVLAPGVAAGSTCPLKED